MRRVCLDTRRLPGVVRDFVFSRSGAEAMLSAYEAILPIRNRVVLNLQNVNGGQDHEQDRKSWGCDLRSSGQ